jgi:hypothetical protein
VFVFIIIRPRAWLSSAPRKEPTLSGTSYPEGLFTRVRGRGFCELRRHGVLGRWDEKADPPYAVPLGLQLFDGL